MKGYLLDANVLLALAWPKHVHHTAAQEWFRANQAEGWATCAVTQLAFVRLSSHPSFTRDHVSPQQARAQLSALERLPHHRYWGDPPGGVSSRAADPIFAKTLVHPLVTDAYLVALAAHHGGRLATFDAELVRLFGAAACSLGAR